MRKLVKRALYLEIGWRDKGEYTAWKYPPSEWHNIPLAAPAPAGSGTGTIVVRIWDKARSGNRRVALEGTKRVNLQELREGVVAISLTLKVEEYP